MSQITTEHAGHEITYSENEDVWRCWNLDAEAKTLSALKAKINKHLAEARRIGNVRVWKIEWGDAPALHVVTLLEGDAAAWVSKVNGKTNGRMRDKVREKASLKNLVLDTPENRAAIEAWRALERAAAEASRKARDAKEALPHPTQEDLKAAGTAEIEAA